MLTIFISYKTITLMRMLISLIDLERKINKLLTIDPLHDDVKKQNKPGALCIVGFIRGPLSDNTVIIPPF